MYLSLNFKDYILKKKILIFSIFIFFPILCLFMQPLVVKESTYNFEVRYKIIDSDLIHHIHESISIKGYLSDLARLEKFTSLQDDILECLNHVSISRFCDENLKYNNSKFIQDIKIFLDKEVDSELNYNISSDGPFLKFSFIIFLQDKSNVFEMLNYFEKNISLKDLYFDNLNYFKNNFINYLEGIKEEDNKRYKYLISNIADPLGYLTQQRKIKQFAINLLIKDIKNIDYKKYSKFVFLEKVEVKESIRNRKFFTKSQFFTIGILIAFWINVLLYILRKKLKF